MLVGLDTGSSHLQLRRSGGGNGVDADAPRCPAIPIASQRRERTTLWGGLIETLRHNLNRQQERVRIFELGRVYASQVEQPMKLGGLAYGEVQPEQWGATARRIDFFDLKGDLERLFSHPLDSRRGAHPALHPDSAPNFGRGRRSAGLVHASEPGAGIDLPPCRCVELDSQALARVPCHASGLVAFPLVRAIWRACWTFITRP